MSDEIECEKERLHAACEAAFGGKKTSEHEAGEWIDAGIAVVMHDGLLYRAAREPCECCAEAASFDVTFAPDPFASEIHNDETPRWLCSQCRYESAMDI